MSSKTTSACLLIADIGGYTRYLSGVELDHSHDIVADLIQTVVGALCPPFTLAKLEGDAVFCYDDGAPVTGEELLETVDDAYVAFFRRLRDIRFATVCMCEACRRTPDLSLKFVVHSGDFMIHDVAGQRELIGPNIILLHRLLKNHVTEQHGIAGYALISEACATTHDLDPLARGGSEHTETYESVGDIPAFIFDLEIRRLARERRDAIVLTEGDSIEVLDTVYPAPREEIWEWYTDPVRRTRWSDGTTGMEQSNPGGVRGAGTVNHCMHGDAVILEEVIDWRPFEYYTSRFMSPDVGAMTCDVRVHTRGGGDARAGAGALRRPHGPAGTRSGRPGLPRIRRARAREPHGSAARVRGPPRRSSVLAVLTGG